MYHHPHNLPHNQQNLQQQQLPVQPQQQQHQMVVAGMKRPFSEQNRDNLENSDNIQLASKRFHPMEGKENWRNGGAEEERAEESAADDEEETISHTSNSSFSDTETAQLQQRTTTGGTTASSNALHPTQGCLPPMQSLAGTSSTASATCATAQLPYQPQNIGPNFFARAETSALEQQLRSDLQNPYQFRPLSVAAPNMTGTVEQSANILRNFQNFYPSMLGAGGHLQQHQQSYGIVPMKAMEGQNFQMMAQHPMFSFGPASAHPSHYSVSPFAQQMPSSSHRPLGNTLMAPQQPQHGITTMLNREMMTSFEARDESINNDSGLGLIDRSGKGGLKDSKNESTSTDESVNLSTRGELADGHLSNATAAIEDSSLVAFPSFARSVMFDGVQQIYDLEKIVYSEAPARLALLGNMSKYEISLAEIVRRVSPPECLNTSFLSGILRRAKNKDGGKRFRMELQKFNCGVDLQTGRRKNGAITTFTALCERESVQLAKDFDKLSKDEHHGFPDKELAIELCRRAGVDSMGKPNCKHLLDNFQNASKILRDAIQLLERGIEQETGELASLTPAEFMVQQQQQQHSNEPNDTERDLMNRFKRFARLSHCFGNRGMLSAWHCLLSVLGNCEFALLQQISDSSH